MTEYNIPNSIKDIIDKFIDYGFRPFTYKNLAYRLDVEPNTLVQRINRHLKYFEIKGDRPKIITLNKDLEEIYFYRDKNTCQICKKKKNPSELSTRPKDPFMEEKNKSKNNLHDWNNVITNCIDCKSINLIKRLSYKKMPEHINLNNFQWEYKEIEVRTIYKKRNPYAELYFPGIKDKIPQYDHYYEVNELDGQGWYHIIDDNNEICRHLPDILNYYGNLYWELFSVKQLPPELPEDSWGNDRYLFKRKKVIAEVKNEKTK